MATVNVTGQRSPHSAAIPTRMLRHDGDTVTCGTWTPEEEDEPVSIVVGARAPLEKLQRLAVKHRLEAEALIRFARRRA